MKLGAAPSADSAAMRGVVPVPDKERARLDHAARELEGVFLRKMLAALEKTAHAGDDKAKAPGGDIYGGLIVSAMADALSAAGGIGLARTLSQTMAPPGAQLPLATTPHPLTSSHQLSVQGPPSDTVPASRPANGVSPQGGARRAVGTTDTEE